MSGSSPALNTAITNLNTAQAAELQQFVTDLRANPTNLRSYITTNSQNLQNSAIAQKNASFNKVYGDTVRASNTQNNIYYYYTRNKDLDTMQKELYDRAQYDLESSRHDKDLAQRQYEINEWSYGNKMETLFIFQMILIAFVLMTPLLYFSRQGLVPTSVLSTVGILFAVIIILTIAIRAQYTTFSRDKRYWNRQLFNRQGGPAIPPPNCESLSQAYDAAGDAIGSAGSGIAGVASDIGSRISAAGSALAGN
jgi:hypothetical protein